MDNTDTIGILKQLERGEISAAEADARLDQPGARLDAPRVVERDYEPLYEETHLRRWVRRLWIYPLIGGLVLVALGAWIIVSTIHANVLWLLLGLPILLFGTAVLAVAASAESGHWLYVNIKPTREGHALRFGVPFPLGLIRVGLGFARWLGRDSTAHFNFHGRTFRIGNSWTDADELLSALDRELREQRGITVDVDDQDERVQVYIV